MEGQQLSEEKSKGELKREEKGRKDERLRKRDESEGGNRRGLTVHRKEKVKKREEKKEEERTVHRKNEKR